MSILNIVHVAGTLGSLGALLFLWLGRRNAPSRPGLTLFSLIMILTIIHDLGNFLEWAGIISLFDPVEDYLEVLISVLWGFFFYTFLQDMTEKALRLSEEKYRRLFEVGNDVIIVYEMGEDGEPGLLVDVNDIACHRLGYTKEELLGMRPTELNDPEYAGDMHQVMETLVRKERAVFDRIHVTKDGRKIPVEVSSQMFDLFGKRVVMCIARDVTQRLESERMIKELQELDEKILDSSPVAFVLRDRDLRIVRVSRAFKRVTGYDPEMAMGKTLDEFMPEGPGREALNIRLRKVLDEGIQVGPEDITAPTLETRHIRETILPLFAPDGKVSNILSVLEDITARIETEKKLRDIQELDEKILSASPVAFVLHDRDLCVIRVSRAYQDVTGFIPDQIVGRSLEEFMPEGPQRRKIIQNLRKVQEYGVQIGPEDIESPIPGRFLREAIIPIFGQDGDVINTLSVLEDITDRKKAADERRESEQRYRTLFENIHNGVTLHRMTDDGNTGNFLQVNAAFCELVEYAQEDLLGMTPLEISDTEKRADIMAVRSSLLSGKSVFFERILYAKSGREIQCEIRSESFRLGNETVVLSVFHDITERVKAEKRIRASLKEKEILLREIHHRVKNNLHVISGLLNLQSHYVNDEGVRSIFKESQNRIKTMAIIHEELYQREDLAFVNLAQYVRELAENLFASYSVRKDQVQLILDLEETDLVLDTAIPCGLIVNELLSNSLKHAFPDGLGGEIRITLRKLAKGRFSLSVSDNGVGLPKGFDLGNTRSMGTQLVKILSEQLGGELRYTVDDGTSFQIEFAEYREAGTVVHGPTDLVS